MTGAVLFCVILAQAPSPESLPSPPESPPSSPESPPSPESVPSLPSSRAVGPAEPAKLDGSAPLAVAPPGATSGGRAAPMRALTMEQVSEGTTEEMTIRNVRWRYSLNFFGDVSLGIASSGAPHPELGFAIGAQDFLLKGELGSHFVALTEFDLEPGDAGIDVDIERYHVRWQSEHVFVQMGRSHTAFGYWNNAYHHGRWLQPTIERPRWVAFEDDGGLLPVHWVGLNLGAKLELGSARLDAVVSVGNGRGKVVDDVRNTRDYQSLKAFHASVELVGIYWSELRAGVAAVVDRIVGQPDRVALPGQAIDELIGGVHVAYAGLPLLVIAEGYSVIHQAGSQRWSTAGGFGLIAYAFGRFSPYVEVESFVPRGGPDPFFLPNPAEESPSFDTLEGIAGLRIDLSDWTALKAELRETRLLDRSVSIREGLVNWSWGF